MSKNYSESEVVSQLQKKNDINISGKQIQILKGASAKNDIGIKSKGKVDFLVHYCGFHTSSVTKFTR